jgi:hypothetical protein
VTHFGSDYPTLQLLVEFDTGSAYVDITDYMRQAYISRPPSRETGRYPAGVMTVVLDNRDARFTPINLAGPYVDAGATQVLPDINVLMIATWDSTDYTLFFGTVEEWQDEFREQGTDAVTVLTVVDPLAQVASYNRPAGSEVGAGENSESRINRILSPLSINRATTTGDATVQATTLAGNALDECYLTVDSEGGALWYDPNVPSFSAGAIVFEPRSALGVNSRSTTSQATFGGTSMPFRDLRTSSGRDKLLREANYARVGGSLQTSGSGIPSVTRSDLICSADTDAKALTELAVAVGDPAYAYRILGFTLLPASAPSTLWPEALGRRIRDRVTVTETIPVSGFDVDTDVFIDGISHTITASPIEWSTSFEFASVSAWNDFDTTLWDSGVWDTAIWFY